MKLNSIKMPEEVNFLTIGVYQSVYDTITKQLRSAQFTGEIINTRSAADALSALKNTKIDFMISDWNLPDISGIELLKKIRSIPKHRNIPFLMATKENDVAKILEATQEGASDYLVTPWTQNEFYQKIYYAWSKHLPYKKAA